MIWGIRMTTFFFPMWHEWRMGWPLESKMAPLTFLASWWGWIEGRQGVVGKLD